MSPDEKLSVEKTRIMITIMAQFLSTVAILDVILRNPEISETDCYVKSLVNGMEAVALLNKSVEGKIPVSTNEPMTPNELKTLLAAVLAQVDRIRTHKE